MVVMGNSMELLAVPGEGAADHLQEQAVLQAQLLQQLTHQAAHTPPQRGELAGIGS